MKLKPLLPFLLCAIIILISCEKEASFETVNPPDPTPPAGADSSYLDKIYYSEYAGTSTIPDTGAITTFYYDSQKRLDSFVTSYRHTQDTIEKYSFFYSGLDSLPYKSVSLIQSGSEVYTEIHFNYYNASQLKIKDSVINIYVGSMGGTPIYTVVTLFSFSGSLRIANSLYELDSMQLDASGNIVSSKNYSWNGLDWELLSTSQFTYDNHKTPFQKIKAFRSFNNIPYAETFLFDYFPNNEIKTQVQTYQGSPTLSLAMLNTYNTTGSGFVKKSVISFIGEPRKDVVQFTYKKL